VLTLRNLFYDIEFVYCGLNQFNTKRIDKAVVH